MIKFCSKYIVTGVIVILITDYLINKWIGTGLLEDKSIFGLIIEFIIIDFIPLLIICYFASILITDVIRRNVKGMYISLYFIINFICMLILRNVPAEYMHKENELSIYNHYGLCIVTAIFAVYNFVKERYYAEEYSRYKTFFSFFKKTAVIITSIVSCNSIMIYYVIISFIVKYTGLKQ